MERPVSECVGISVEDRALGKDRRLKIGRTYDGGVEVKIVQPSQGLCAFFYCKNRDLMKLGRFLEKSAR